MGFKTMSSTIALHRLTFAFKNVYVFHLLSTQHEQKT